MGLQLRNLVSCCEVTQNYALTSEDESRIDCEKDLKFRDFALLERNQKMFGNL